MITMENTEIAIVAKNISKTFHITEDSHNTVKQRLFNLFNSPKKKKVEVLKTPSKGKHISLTKYNGTIFYGGRNGIFKLDAKTGEFVKDISLSSILKNDEFVSGKFNVDKSNKMWLFTKN